MKVTLLSMTLIFPAFTLLAENSSQDRDVVNWSCTSGEGREQAPEDFDRFCTMDPRQRQEVRDNYNLARMLFVQGKYFLCLEQLEAVHAKITRFEKSDELKEYCEQGDADSQYRGETRRIPSAQEKIKKSN